MCLWKLESRESGWCTITSRIVETITGDPRQASFRDDQQTRRLSHTGCVTRCALGLSRCVVQYRLCMVTQSVEHTTHPVCLRVHGSSEVCLTRVAER